jgi:hypothetical protein
VNTPVLLDWYTRHGFEIRPPDGRCIGNAIHLVVWKVPPNNHGASGLLFESGLRSGSTSTAGSCADLC